MPENTTRNPHPEWTMGGNPDAIIEQEKAGQAQLTQESQLPVRLIGCTEDDLTAAGITLGAPVDGDPLFRHVEFPPGWALVPTEHQMWSALVDGGGVERFAVFYKAAFYDRKAHVMPTPEDDGRHRPIDPNPPNESGL